MRPVDIQIKDKYKFQRVAFLVDRDDFLNDLELARDDVKNGLGLDDLIDHNHVIDYLEKLRNQAEKDKNKTSTLDNFQNDDTDMPIITDARFVKIINWFKRKYMKTSYYDMVITQSLLSGVVEDNDIIMGTAYVQFLNDVIIKNLSHEQGIFQVSIVVTPETQSPEIERIFNKDVKEAFKNIGMPKWDPHSKIKDVRDWYWLRKNNKLGWLRLSKEINKNKQIRIPESTIRTDINNYKKKLNTKIY